MASKDELMHRQDLLDLLDDTTSKFNKVIQDPGMNPQDKISKIDIFINDAIKKGSDMVQENVVHFYGKGIDKVNKYLKDAGLPGRKDEDWLMDDQLNYLISYQQTTIKGWYEWLRCRMQSMVWQKMVFGIYGK
jgi:hypothetical protein